MCLKNNENPFEMIFFISPLRATEVLKAERFSPHLHFDYHSSDYQL